METGAILRVVEVCVDFPLGGKHSRVLDHCSLEVGEGDFHAVVGLSGAGKSILTSCVMGRVPSPGRIVSGQVLLRGQNILAASDAAKETLAGKVAFIPPTGRALLNPTTTIGDQIGMILDPRSEKGTSQRAEAVVDILRRVGIGDPERRAGAYPHELSGGMTQRAVVAVALASSPRLLVADEMTANLDVTVQVQVLDVLSRLGKEEELSVLYVTRDLGIVAQYCGMVSVLERGKVVETRRTVEFFENPQSTTGRELLGATAEAGGDGVVRRRTSLKGTSREGRANVRLTSDDARVVLEVKGLAKQFQSPRTREIVHAVRKVGFRIGVGETLALVGESGSGKTTVGRCILRLIDPDEGQIVILGEDVTRQRPRREFRSQVQLVLQDPYDSLNPRWTVRRILSDPLRLLVGRTRKQANSAARDLLGMVGLPSDVLEKYPHELTGGNQQLVGIARAMASSPRLIVLDEPTSRLDSVARQHVIETLARIQSETDVAYLFISHDLVAVRSIASQIAVMYLGKIVEEGHGEEIFERPMHPYTMALLSSVLEADPTATRRPFELTGEIPSPIALPTGCPLHPRCPAARGDCREIVPGLEPRGVDMRRLACIRVPKDADPDWSPWELLPAGASERREGANERGGDQPAKRGLSEGRE